MQQNPTEKASRTSVRYEALDGWRGIAALSVAMFHFQVASHIYFLPFIRNAYLMVDFFFVLSGFVIAHAYYNRLNDEGLVGIFFFRRIGRIWPMHALMLLVFILAETTLLMLQHRIGAALPRPPFSADRNAASIPTNLLLLNGVSSFQFGTWNGPSWSVSAELWVNLLFGVCAAYLPRKYMPLAAFGCMVASAAALALLSPTYLDSKDAFSLARCGYGFFLGFFVWKLFCRGLPHLSSRPLATSLEILVILFAFTVVSFSQVNIWQMLLPIVFAIFIAVFANQAGMISNFMEKRVFLTLGRLSYSIYIMHFFIAFCLYNAIRVGGKLAHLQPTLPGTQLAFIKSAYVMDFVTIVYLAVILMAAYLANRYVEIPAMQWFNERAKRMRANKLEQRI